MSSRNAASKALVRLTVISFLVLAVLDEFACEDVGLELLSGDEVVVLSGDFTLASWPGSVWNESRRRENLVKLSSSSP